MPTMKCLVVLVRGTYLFCSTECGCDPDGSNSTVCDVVTGQCSCQPNVLGRTCSACSESHFGLMSGSGCSPCECHPMGSVMSQCDVTTGSCTCQLLVTGRTCNECEPGAYGLTSSGCTGKQCVCVCVCVCVSACHNFKHVQLYHALCSLI